MQDLLAQVTDAGHVNVPLGWVLAALGGLATTIATLAGTVFLILNSRISAQSVIIKDQAASIQKLQGEIERMATGCGAGGCFWSMRRVLLPTGATPAPTPEA